VASAVACLAAYLAALGAAGQLAAGGLTVALTRMLILDASLYLALIGISDLQHKRRLVARLRADDARKMGELVRLTESLDERTRALLEANARIREADRMKSRFLATMSHELRTPLNSIIGFSEILKTKIGPQLDARFARFLENIHTSGTHLLGLINDLLDLSKIEAGKLDLHPEKVLVSALCDSVVAVVRGMAAEKSIEFETDLGDAPSAIEADPVRLKQVLYNLLSNAVKFSPAGAPVRLTARALRPSESGLGVEALELKVIDRGIGIDPAHHELIFEEFEQVDTSSSREYPGTGLGLALVKKLVELHRGHVDVASRLGEGAAFRVVVPRVFLGTSETSRSITYPPEDLRPLVLVVEDDLTTFARIQRLLEAGGYRVKRARSGGEALGRALELRPAAITLDLVLPEMDGWQVLRSLKENSITRDIPVVIVSMVENHELGLALGADGYFLKPPDAGALLRRIQELAPSRGRPRRLLLIDDDLTVHELLAEMLTPHGFVLEVAASGEKGLAAARRRPPDLVLLDLVMPGMDGFAVAAQLRTDPATATVPVVVLTSKDISPRDHERLSGTVNALVKKGETSQLDLVSALEQVLARNAGAVEHG
jgi:signal transduction histidine kinase/CheY-like chemotaxis protein